MFEHAPVDYDCPFCRLLAGENMGPRGSVQNDIIYRDERVAAIIASKWWWNNKGHVIVLPVAHHENLYLLPDELAPDIQRLTRRVALAMKEAYGCEGISTRQHNEPAGMQSVWHFHQHIYPRYRRDFLNLTWGRSTTPVQRHPYAEKLKAVLANMQDESTPY